MKGFLLFVAGLAVGVVAMFLLAPVVLGVGAGVGIVTGLKAGACLTVEAAKERGFITAAQVDEVLRAAGKQIASSSDMKDEVALSGGDAECAKVVAEMKKAAQKK